MTARKGYTLILNEPGLTPTEFNLIPSPEDVQAEKTALTTLISLPNHSFYRESHGNGIEEVTLSGTFGYRNRQVGPVSWSGAEMFFAFRKGFWDYYLDLISSDDPVKKKTTIEYHNWDEDEHYYAEPVRFSTPRGRDNRTFFRYEIVLRLYQKIEYKFEIPTEDALSLADRIVKFFTSVLEDLKAAGEWLAQKAQDVASFFQRFVLQPIASITSAIRDFVIGVTEIVNVPFRTINSIGNAIASTIEQFGDIVGDTLTITANNLRNVKRMLNRLEKAPEIFKKSISGGLEELSEQYYLLVGDDDSEVTQDEKRGGRNLLLKQQGEEIKNRTYRGAKRAKIRVGDTLPKMAARYLNDASRWREIALFNSILDPDISSLAGQDILVPTISAVDGTGVVGDLGDTEKATNDSMSTRLYGRDIKVIEIARKLSVSFGPNDDLVLVSGESNLAQAIMLKSRIYQGQLLENLDFGLAKIVGNKATPAETDALLHGLKVAAESDPRIESAEVSIKRDGNITEANYLLTPVGVAGNRQISAVVGV